MTLYTLEAGYCFQPSSTAYTAELRTPCDVRSTTVEGAFAPFTDGAFFLDLDGMTLVGWIELDGTLFPPANVLAEINA